MNRNETNLDFKKVLDLTERFEDMIFLRIWSIILIISSFPFILIIISIIIRIFFIFSSDLSLVLINFFRFLQSFQQIILILIIAVGFIYAYNKGRKTYIYEGAFRTKRSITFLGIILLMLLIPFFNSLLVFSIIGLLAQVNVFELGAFNNFLMSFLYLGGYFALNRLIDNHRPRELLFASFVTISLTGIIFIGCFLLNMDEILGFGENIIDIIVGMDKTGGFFIMHYSIAEFFTVYLIPIVFLIMHLSCGIYELYKSRKILDGAV